jgi:hypothetical protein
MGEEVVDTRLLLSPGRASRGMTGVTASVLDEALPGDQ